VTATRRPIRTELAGLTAHVAGGPDAPMVAVFLHGFGAGGDDLVPLAGEIDRERGRPGGGAAPAVTYVFPEAPLELGGMYGAARAWWLLDLERLEEDLRRGAPRERRDEVPDGLLAAREQVLRFFEQALARFGAPGARLVLGGFSQGAMLALDAALHRAAPPAGLILMSGTLINEAAWQPRLPSLRGVPVLLSHGRADPLLPFSAAELLRDRLRAAGAEVAWHPFVGGHEIPRVVIAAAAELLGG
jgi:phospholipase/carboxylesterase